MIVDALDNTSRKIKIALDFDGVLHSYVSGFSGPIPFDPPVPGAQGFCQALLDRGYELSIFTTRAHPLVEPGDKKAFVELLERVEIPGEHSYKWFRVSNGPPLGAYAIRAWLKHHLFPSEMQACEVTHKKVHADLYIDDRAWRFDGRDKKCWNELLLYLESDPECKTWTGKQ